MQRCGKGTVLPLSKWSAHGIRISIPVVEGKLCGLFKRQLKSSLALSKIQHFMGQRAHNRAMPSPRKVASGSNRLARMLANHRRRGPILESGCVSETKMFQYMTRAIPTIALLFGDLGVHAR